MTDIQFVNVAESIAGLNVPGVRCTSVIPEDATKLCPLFSPRPDNFITEIAFTRDSFGSGGTAKMTLTYTMHWQYFHAPVGSGLGLFSTYWAMMSNLAVILETIANNDAPDGAVDVQPLTIDAIAKISDASGNFYHGVDMAFRVTEYING